MRPDRSTFVKNMLFFMKVADDDDASGWLPSLPEGHDDEAAETSNR